MFIMRLKATVVYDWQTAISSQKAVCFVLLLFRLQKTSEIQTEEKGTDWHIGCMSSGISR